MLAAATMAGALTRQLGWWPLLVVAAIGALIVFGSRPRLALTLLILSLVSARAGPVNIPIEQAGQGRRSLEAVVTGRPTETRFGWTTRIRSGSTPLDAFSDERPPVDLGNQVRVSGLIAGGRNGQVVRHADFVVIARSPPYEIANRLRARILIEVEPTRDRSRALLAGFLVGHTSDLPAADQEDLRRSGLSHFTAVSGSNVALFLGLWTVLLGPLGWTPRRRAIASLVGVLLFAAVTGFDSSVVRAGAMVWVVMIGRLAGMPVDGWTALGVAVAGSVLVAPGLATSLGFQLSVAATAGVMAGAEAVRFRPRWAALALSSSLAAQVSVAPLLIARFGTIPLLSPAANLLAAPLVGGATVVGGLGALSGWDVLITVGAWLARLVLLVSAGASSWPQVGWLGFAVAGACGLVAARSPTWRAPLLAGMAVWLVVGIGPLTAAVEAPAVVFLDVGQGDAALVLSHRATVLVDGGPDPAVLAAALRRFGIRSIDLVVVSHAHADHIDGLEAVLGRLPVGVIWAAFGSHSSPSSEWLGREAGALGIQVVAPGPGMTVDLGDIRIEVLGPLRRYANTNDESIVIEVVGTQRRVLFTGDIEAIAQMDIATPPVDILKVPHHGSDSSDLGWLSEHAGRLAIVSVGANDFGHPSEAVLATLEDVGAEVHRTDTDGDLVVGLDRPP